MEEKKGLTLFLKGRVSVFQNEDGEAINYFHFFTEVPVGDGKLLPVKFDIENKTDKRLIGKALGLNRDFVGAGTKELPLQGDLSQFTSKKTNQKIKTANFSVMVPVDGDPMRINIKPADTTGRNLLWLVMGLTLRPATVSELEALSDEDLPF